MKRPILIVTDKLTKRQAMKRWSKSPYALPFSKAFVKVISLNGLPDALPDPNTSSGYGGIGWGDLAIKSLRFTTRGCDRGIYVFSDNPQEAEQIMKRSRYYLFCVKTQGIRVRGNKRGDKPRKTTPSPFQYFTL